MDQFAREIEEEHAAKRKAAREAERKTDQRQNAFITADKKPEALDADCNNFADARSKIKSSETPTTRFVASNAFIRSSVEELTDRALKQAIRDANKKLEEDYKSGKITKRKKFNAE